MNFLDFIRKKANNPIDDLEKAEKEGLITKEEHLALKLKRAEKELKDFLEGGKKKK